MINDTGVRPVQDRVSVRRDKPKDRTAGGLYVPSGLETWPTIGTVLAVGPRVSDPDIVPGARVFFLSRPSSALITDNREADQPEEWERVMQLRVSDIVGIIEEE